MGDDCLLGSVLWYVGLVAVLKFIVWDLLRALYKRLLRSPTDLNRFGRREGFWAVVTGASDGIGKAFAVELAKRGFNVLMISRTESKLKAVQSEIKEKHKAKTQVEYLTFDFSDASASYAPIAKALEGKEVGILVNNVGVNYPYPGNYLDTAPELNEQIVTVNISALNQMTRLVLPKMVAKKKGGVINVSSLSGVVPAPMLSAYSGSKAYINFFSLCLSAEYKRSGIAFQSITPSMVVSNMSKIRSASLLRGVTTPQVIAKGSLDTLGQEIHWSPFWVHALIEYVFHKLPLGLVLDKINQMHIGIRKRAQAKEKKEKGQ
jgi:17beta-estradiol 17-dehydrogenase / very-long-chain 3-oxoacyl-CoA reductase